MDIFAEYICAHKDDEICRALTCVSYKKVYQKQHRKELDDKQTNFELATYGDALLKFALCNLLLNEVSQLSEHKKQYEEDKFLIEVVAQHYNLLEYIKFDREDKKIRQEYKFYKTQKDKKNPTKYIATTVEAVLGAIYKENNDFGSICKLIESWIDLYKQCK